MESWRIEGLRLSEREYYAAIRLHQKWIDQWLQEGVQPADVEDFAFNITGGYGRLRCLAGMDVTVGKHIPLGGGPAVVAEFEDLIRAAHTLHPFTLYQRFEHLHPFMDGNGRTGRLLWLWSMIRKQETIDRSSFLHEFHYQSLAHWRPD